MIGKTVRRAGLRIIGAAAIAATLAAGIVAADLAHATHPIARMWRGHVRAADADAYQKHLDEGGVQKIRKIAGNTGVQMFRRDEGETTEFVVISYWKTVADIQNFTGPDWEKVKPLPDDAQWLVGAPATVTHYEVVEDK